MAQPGRRPTRRVSSGARLFRFDRSLGGRLVGGADEAGRGCLAGPLVAAAVAFAPHDLSASARRELRHLDDSKRLSAAARTDLAAAIVRHARQVVVRSVCAPSLDRAGLHRSNLDLLARCLADLDPMPDVCCSDGFRLPPPAPDHRAIVGGDGTSAAIAAASIMAKTVRDRMMTGPAAERFPGYGFDRHVGYATPDHRHALVALGLTPLHRRSFNSVAYQQISLFEVTVADRTRPDDV